MTPIERFEASFIPVTESGCYLWLKARDRDGYGVLRVGSRSHVRAHRFSYETYIGPLGNHEYVLHKCDNTSCVRPEHLEIGSLSKNSKDSYLRGRHSQVGSNNSGSKMTEEQVIEARKMRLEENLSVTLIAKKYGMSISGMSQVLSGTNWRHV